MKNIFNNNYYFITQSEFEGTRKKLTTKESERKKKNLKVHYLLITPSLIVISN